MTKRAQTTSLKEKWRLVQAIGNVFVFVASELKGRKRLQVEPFRDCCVNAYGLLGSESGDFIAI